jgi:hypothetical protein
MTKMGRKRRFLVDCIHTHGDGQMQQEEEKDKVDDND